MSKFDSHKWTREFKEAWADSLNEKDEKVTLKDLLHTIKVDDKKADKVDIKLGAENDLAIEKDKDGNDVYASGLKEAQVNSRLMEKMDTMSNSDIASLQKMISKYDIAKIQNVIKILSDRLAESGITETDYSTMRLQSNIDQKWHDSEDMKNDLRQWVEASMQSGGYDLLDDIVSALEVEVRLYKIYRKKMQR